MGAFISSLVIVPLMLIAVAALQILAVAKYSDESLCKTLTITAIVLVFITVLISFFLGIL